MRKQYEPLVQRLTDRYELDDLLAQMVGELSALHTFVYGGDKRVSPDQIPVGFLGARLRKTATWRPDRTHLSKRPGLPGQSSPLDKPELRIREGDIITAVDNASLDGTPDISMLLANKVNVPVKLSLVDRAATPV